MSRQTILDALDGIRDEYITEAGAKLGLLSVTAAVGAIGAAVDPANLYSLSTTKPPVKKGFGAWLKGGGWVALVAGVLVAAGIAAGVFFLEWGGYISPVGSEEVTTGQMGQEIPEDTSDVTEEDTRNDVQDETAGGTETESDPSADAENESETLAPSDFLKYVSNGHGTCYVAQSSDPWPSMDIVIPPVSPDGDIVTAIGKEAFRGRGITSIVIPDTVTRIEDYAFYDCWDLTSISIPDSVVSIGSKVFENSKKVRRRKDGLYYVGNWVVDCDAYLSKIVWKEGTKGILEHAFEGCYKLTSIVIPDGVVMIGDYAFADCPSVTSVVMPDSVTELGAYAFEDCFTLSSMILSNNLSAIQERTFSNCYALTSIVIPDTVTAVGDYAFNKCSSLTSVTGTGGLTDIGHGAFKNCSALTSMTIPDSVTHIGTNAFEGCTGLAQEDGVTYVGNWIVACDRSVSEVVCREGTIGIANAVFEDCFYMKTITIPTSLEIIGDNAFYVYRVKDIYYAGSEKRWRRIRIGQFNNGLSDVTIHYNYVP